MSIKKYICINLKNISKKIRCWEKQHSWWIHKDGEGGEVTKDQKIESKRRYRQPYEVRKREMALVAKGGSAAGVKRRATRKQSLGRARIYGCSFLLFPQLSLSHFLFLTRARPPLSVRQMVRPRFCFKTRANNRRIRDKTARRSVLWKKKKNARKRDREREMGWK